MTAAWQRVCRGLGGGRAGVVASVLAVVAPAQGNGSWEQGFDHCISPTTFPFGTDPTTPFQGAPYYIPPPTPPNVGSASPQVYAANYFWGEGQLFANVHKRAFNAVHMALIPKGPHQGKVLVFGSWWPVLLRPNDTLEPNHKEWFCQAWSIIDPDTSRVPTPAEPRFLNYLLPLRARTSPVVEDVQPPPDGRVRELVPQMFCSGHAWSQEGDLIVAGGATRWVYMSDHVPPEPVDGLSGGATFLWMFDPSRLSQPFVPGSTAPLYAPALVPGTNNQIANSDLGHWQEFKRQLMDGGLLLDRYYPTVTLSQLLTRAGTGTEAVIVAGGTNALGPAGTAINSYETYLVRASTVPAPLSPDPALTANGQSFSGPVSPQSPEDELGEYARIHLVGDVGNSSFPVFVSGVNKFGSRIDIDTTGSLNTWQTGVGRNLTTAPTQSPPLTWDHERHDGASVLLCLNGASVCVRLGGSREVAPFVFEGTTTAEFCVANAAPGPASDWSVLPSSNGKEAMPGGPRQWPNAVVLPDASILVIGGADPSNLNPEFTTVLYRANIGWEDVEAPSPGVRGYHSTALLLPDGRVFVGGGELPGSPVGEHDYDIYVPHYLQGDPIRPQIVSVTQAGGGALPLDGTGTALVLARSPGAQFTVTCEKIEALDQVDHVVLMAPGSVTHHFDMSARYVLLGGGHVGGNNKTWQFQLPDAGTLPRGYYMMFALNNAGVPSVATWVQVQ